MQPGQYGAPPVAPHPATEPLKPNGWWYVVAAGLAIGGIVIAVVIGVRAAVTYSDRIDGFERVDVPGVDTVLLESGGHTIYHEYAGAGDEFGFSPSVSVSVAAPDGSAVELDDYTGSFTYGTTDHEGEALFTFDAEEPGDYTVRVEGESGSEIAVGRGLASGLFAGIAGALVAGFGGVVAGIIIAIVVAVKRSGARTRRQLALVRGGWAPPGTPGAWPSGPQPPGAGMPPSTWTPPARPQYPTPGQPTQPVPPDPPWGGPPAPMT